MPTAPLNTARSELIAVGREFDARGWTPATSGNLSARLADGAIEVTASGAHKGRLTEADFVTIGANGRTAGGRQPSAETALHLQIYASFPDVGAVLHIHSPGAVAFTRAFPQLSAWVLEGHELLKALPGLTTHETSVTVPIVANDQDMTVIAGAIEARLQATPRPPAYLIRGHGLYGWGRDVAEAERVIEALEWLFTAELTERQFRAGAPP